MTNEIDWTKAPEGTEIIQEGCETFYPTYIKNLSEDKYTSWNTKKGKWQTFNGRPNESRPLITRPKPLQPVLNKEEFEYCNDSGTHNITSEHILCCAETGRVVAVFYNERDLLAATGLIKKVELIDGEFYKFETLTFPERGIYDCNGSCMWDKGKPHLLKDICNIKLLEVKS